MIVADVVLFVILYLAFGVVGYGLTFAYFTDRWPYFKPPYDISLLIGIMGPMGMIVALIMSGWGKKGIRYKPLSEEEAWAAHQAAFPALGIDAFYQTWRR